MTDVEPTPGDLGRLALSTDPIVVAAQLAQWVDRLDERARVIEWFRDVADALGAIE